jgi:hypothetical protein
MINNQASVSVIDCESVEAVVKLFVVMVGGCDAVHVEYLP